MSVYREFLEHIQNEGLYVPGYNYEEMYNIMVDALTNNKDSSNNFIYTQQQVTNLYEVLDEFLYPYYDSDLPIESNQNNTNNANNANNATNTNNVNNMNNIIALSQTLNYIYNTNTNIIYYNNTIPSNQINYTNTI
jgi:hypothetical protein